MRQQKFFRTYIRSARYPHPTRFSRHDAVPGNLFLHPVSGRDTGNPKATDFACTPSDLPLRFFLLGAPKRSVKPSLPKRGGADEDQSRWSRWSPVVLSSMGRQETSGEWVVMRFPLVGGAQRFAELARHKYCMPKKLSKHYKACPTTLCRFFYIQLVKVLSGALINQICSSKSTSFCYFCTL